MATTENLNIEKITGADYVDYESFNTAYDTLDKLGVSYVTKKGNSGDWYYRAWSDGRYEAWFAKTFDNMSMNTPWGNLYQCEISSISFPIAFLSKPHMTITFATTSGNTAFVVPNIGLSTTKTGTLLLCSPASGKTTSGVLSIHVSGSVS